MFQEELHFNLHNELIFELMGFYDCFLHSLYGNQQTGFFMNAHRHSAEPALTQVFDYGKILKLRRLNRVFFHLL
jgi:hypothetical protein